MMCMRGIALARTLSRYLATKQGLGISPVARGGTSPIWRSCPAKKLPRFGWRSQCNTQRLGVFSGRRAKVTIDNGKSPAQISSCKNRQTRWPARCKKNIPIANSVTALKNKNLGRFLRRRSLHLKKTRATVCKYAIDAIDSEPILKHEYISKTKGENHTILFSKIKYEVSSISAVLKAIVAYNSASLNCYFWDSTSSNNVQEDCCGIHIHVQTPGNLPKVPPFPSGLEMCSLLNLRK